MCKECFHLYFCWDTFLLRDFLPILNSPYPLSTTSLFLRITADRQNSVWLENSLYRREVETNADNSRNFKLLFLVQYSAWVLIFEEFILGQHSLSFPFPKVCLGFFCFSYFWDAASTWLKALVTRATLKLPNLTKRQHTNARHTGSTCTYHVPIKNKGVD